LYCIAVCHYIINQHDDDDDDERLFNSVNVISLIVCDGRFEVLASCWMTEPDYRPTSALLQQALTAAHHAATSA